MDLNVLLGSSTEHYILQTSAPLVSSKSFGVSHVLKHVQCYTKSPLRGVGPYFKSLYILYLNPLSEKSCFSSTPFTFLLIGCPSLEEFC